MSITKITKITNYYVCYPVHNNTSSDCTYNRPNRIAIIVPNDKT